MVSLLSVLRGETQSAQVVCPNSDSGELLLRCAVISGGHSRGKAAQMCLLELGGNSQRQHQLEPKIYS